MVCDVATVGPSTGVSNFAPDQVSDPEPLSLPRRKQRAEFSQFRIHLLRSRREVNSAEVGEASMSSSCSNMSANVLRKANCTDCGINILYDPADGRPDMCVSCIDRELAEMEW